MQFFQVNFLKTEWFWAAASLIGMIGTFVISYVSQKRADSSKDIDSRIGEDLRLRSELRQSWTKLASFPEDTENIFAKDISEIKDEEVRLAIFQIIEILHDAHYIYLQRKTKNHLWCNSFEYVFKAKHKVFISAYQKYSSQQHFPIDFTDYVDKLILTQSKS